MKQTIGITGGIGSGKSVVARVLRCNGFYVFDCDFEAKKIMVCNPEVIYALSNRFGEEIYDEHGNLRRKKLAEIIFSDKEERKFVNSVVHKCVIDEIKYVRRRIEGIFFIESAILATGGITPFCDMIWIVDSPLEKRFHRINKRDGIENHEIQKRIEAQEHELRLLKSQNCILIENNDNDSMLYQILNLTNKMTNYQTYRILC